MAGRGGALMAFWKERRVLITGCTGFLGCWLTSELVQKGSRVVGIVRDLLPHAPFFVKGSKCSF